MELSWPVSPGHLAIMDLLCKKCYCILAISCKKCCFGHCANCTTNGRRVEIRVYPTRAKNDTFDLPAFQFHLRNAVPMRIMGLLCKFHNGLSGSEIGHSGDSIFCKIEPAEAVIYAGAVAEWSSYKLYCGSEGKLQKRVQGQWSNVLKAHIVGLCSISIYLYMDIVRVLPMHFHRPTFCAVWTA